MLTSEFMLSQVKPPYLDLSAYLAHLKGDRSYEDLAKLAGTSPSVIHRGLNGGTFPEKTAERLARNLHLSSEDRLYLMEMVGRARGYGHKLTKDWAEKIEKRAIEAEQQVLRLARYVLKFRDQVPHEVIERCEAVLKFFDSRDQG